MLNSALNNMINKTESFMFINTANSTIYMDQNKATADTLSPWIYSEVVMANTMKITPPTRPIRIEKRAEFYHMMNESVAVSQKLTENTIEYGEFCFAAFYNKEHSTDMFVFIDLHAVPLYSREALRRHR